ncbi:hypothetical protein SEA_THYATIRA_90 [Mycobacterium phage Thyatira]|uniref:Uncharacterized protein n=1 Tax=Mycobacterium phage Thyatira TaxID=2283261 RepID=A0A345M9B7_9CAUD|nr:DNA binding protein [Mycobacterium phage Thyatira]AXH67088.1 hypothetical protein SEA_THYATIRA_90 [Mycobacterium phage Thyatira]
MSKKPNEELTRIINNAATMAEVDAEIMGDDVDLTDVKITRGGPRTRVLQVRLNDDEMQAVEDLAASRDLPASTVAREILLSALRPPNDDAEAKAELLGAFARYIEGVDQKMRCHSAGGLASIPISR